MECTDCKCFQDPGQFDDTIQNALVGDGYCDDERNNEKCNFDGGDCCGPCTFTDRCKVCECHENGNATQINALVGNGICNDETNIGDCHYDGFDCCAPIVNTQTCSDCNCNGKPNRLCLFGSTDQGCPSCFYFRNWNQIVKINVIPSIFMKFWSRINLEMLEWLTTQNAY